MRKTPEIRLKPFTDEWKPQLLSELMQLGNGKDYKCLNSGHIPVYGTGGYMLSVDKALSYDRDAIGIGRKGTIDKPYILNAPFWTVDTLFYAVPSEESHLDFLYDVFQTVDWKKKDESTGVPSLSKIAINSTEVFVPENEEKLEIGQVFKNLDALIFLQKQKLEKLKKVKDAMLIKMFPQNGSDVPEIRFNGFTDPWKEKSFGEMFERRSERNYGQFDATRWISVAKMYFQDPQRVTSNNIDTRTYVMRYGDIAFEGHANSEFKIGRFVENDIGDGVISELFPIYKHIDQFDLKFWKYYINNERIMYPRLLRCIEISYTSSNKLDETLFLKENVLVPNLFEQRKIGEFLSGVDTEISLLQQKVDRLANMKKALLSKMFV